MTPEERKALAMRQPRFKGWCWNTDRYPHCCSYHEGFDAALSLLVPFRSAGGTRAFIIEDSP